MTEIPFHSPVEDSVPKVSNEIAVGENLDFQRKWWRFEAIVWPILFLIIVADILGVFGRGWLAKAHRETPDQAMKIDYERIARASTPSIMTFDFGDAAIHHGRIILFVSSSLVKPLGAQRISPQPAVSSVGEGGLTYVFPASRSPATVEIELQPSFPGAHRFRVEAQGSPPIAGTIFVMP